MSRRHRTFYREDLVNAYETYGSFRRAAAALGVSRTTFSKLWWEVVGEDPACFKRCHFRFGIISDTHLGNIHQQLTHLHEFYRTARSFNCEYIIHAGDLTDGISMSVCHHRDRFLSSVNDVIDYVVCNYPSGVETYLISGNHDDNFIKMFGVDVCREISGRRRDMHYIGSMYASNIRHGLNMLITHGVCNYSKESKSESSMYIAKLSSNVPDIIINGHTHTWKIVPRWCDSYLIYAPCMVGGFDGLKKYSVHPSIGAMIVDVYDSRTYGVRFMFYDELENDY